MSTKTIVFRERPSLWEFQQFVETDLGGDLVYRNRCTVNDDRGLVFLDYDVGFSDYYANYLPKTQKDELTSQLGEPPFLAIHLTASKTYSGSRELAKDLGNQILERWPGVELSE